MDYLQEVACKRVHDQFINKMESSKSRCICVPGAVVVGAGPSGLATAALLKENGVPSLILERESCIASLWQLKSYDRLHLHLPKQFCELPNMSFPSSYPTYPTRQQFVSYLESYTATFGLDPVFNCTVVQAEFDPQSGFWRVMTKGLKREEVHYMCRWLVVASGENAEEVVPLIEGMEDFNGTILHSSLYKNGAPYRGKSVLVVGCGNSGMEIGLDLANSGASPSLVVRESVHVLPREMLGRSTFELSMCLLKWLPIRLVDLIILALSFLVLGNTADLGLIRPRIGPFEYKKLTGKTPVLDVGTLHKIKNGDIKIRKAIKRITNNGVEFVDGNIENYDVIVLATGYRSNVPSWLYESNMFSEKDGFPRKAFPQGWKGENGLYAVGFARRGLLGASIDARRVAQDIGLRWKAESTSFTAFAPRPQHQSFDHED